MNDELKKAGMIAIALIMVAATGGFTIYQHYCGCSETSSVSMVKSSPECTGTPDNALAVNYDHMAPDDDAGCCNQHEQGEAEQLPATDNRCSTQGNPSGEPCPVSSGCYTSSIFMKIDELLNTTFKEVSFKIVISLLKIIGNEEFSYHDKNILDKEFYFRGELPPLLSGKEKILAYRQVKIAPPLS